MSKRILITGKNSYVGNQLADWLTKESQEYTVVKESVRDGKWKEIDFSVFDVVVHVAGIARREYALRITTCCVEQVFGHDIQKLKTVICN